MFDRNNRAFVAVTAEKELCFLPSMASRHGLVTGATGTGKTITLQTLAETFSQMGTAVFAADVKGDLSGLAATGGNKASVVKRVENYTLSEKGFQFQSFPVVFWDVFGELGTPVRATVADMGPLLLSHLLNLNDTQSAVLTVIFKISHDESLELVDLKDLQKIIEHVTNNTNQYAAEYGNLASTSLGAVQRGIVALDHEGGNLFFGEPSLAIDDLIRTENGRGIINVLASEKLMLAPKIYTTFLLWLMTKLFEILPEVGDIERPKIVFFFDEAHLLFSDAPKALVEKVEQVVRLIRSKGVGIYFISQYPSDMPDSVLGQLGNRVQHSLRAYTPKDQKALKAAAQTFRSNPAFNTETAIAELGTGEALVSFLDEKGVPSPVERAFILPPQSQVGPLDTATRARVIANAPLNRVYAEKKERVSAFETLSEKMSTTVSEKEQAAQEKENINIRKEQEKLDKIQQRETDKVEKLLQKEAAQKQKFWERIATSVIVPVAKQVLGSLFKTKK